MMPVPTTKVVNSDERTAPVLYSLGWQVYGTQSNLTRPNGITTMTTGSMKTIGRTTAATLQRNGKFIKGEIKLSPATHIGYFAESTPAVHSKFFGYIGNPARLCCLREIWGDVASYLVATAPSAPAPGNYAEYEQFLLTEAIAKYKEASADVGMMLAEGGETLAMLISPFRALPKLLKKLNRPRNYRRPNKGKPGTALSYASSAWLQYRYGIMPLIYDIDTVRGMTRDLFSPRDFPYKKSRTVRQLSSSSITTKFSARGTPGGVYAWGQYTTSTQTTARAMAFYRATNQSSGAQLGVDITSIPSMLWELTPYSFVVDWFADVGTWLRAITPKAGITGLGSCTSIQIKNTTIAETLIGCASPTISATYPASPLCSSIDALNVRYTRSVATTPAQYPELSLGLNSLERRLDSLSLMWQNMPKLAKR